MQLNGSSGLSWCSLYCLILILLHLLWLHSLQCIHSIARLLLLTFLPQTLHGYSDFFLFLLLETINYLFWVNIVYLGDG